MFQEMQPMSIGGGRTFGSIFGHTDNGHANSYVDVTVVSDTSEWYILANLTINSTYDGWRNVQINGVSIGNLSQFESIAVQVGNQSGSYGCYVIPMTYQLHAGDVIRLNEINAIAGLGVIICNQETE